MDTLKNSKSHRWTVWLVKAVVIVFALPIFNGATCTQMDERAYQSLYSRGDSLLLFSSFSQNLFLYKKYQCFDNFKMCGIGEVTDTPFVYVMTLPYTMVVRKSDDMTNPYLFHKYGNYWYSPRNRYIYKSKRITLSGPNPYKSMKFIRNDTLYDFIQHISDGGNDNSTAVNYDLLIYTKKMVRRLINYNNELTEKYFSNRMIDSLYYFMAHNAEGEDVAFRQYDITIDYSKDTIFFRYPNGIIRKNRNSVMGFFEDNFTFPGGRIESLMRY